MNGIYKKRVYIGNPNQTRHLGDHHRRIEVFEQKLHTLLILIKGEDTVTESPNISCSGGVRCNLCICTWRWPESRGKILKLRAVDVNCCKETITQNQLLRGKAPQY